jgi:hypothetical protein
MGFPFNLHAVEWAGHQDALGKSASEVPEWLAALADDHPLAREEAALELQEAFALNGNLAPVAVLAVEPMLKLIESEPCKGRGRAAMLLAQLALGARIRPSSAGQNLLDLLVEGRAMLELLSTRHAASTGLGAALRALLTVLATPQPPAQLAFSLEKVEALVNEADAKDEAAPPTAAELGAWLSLVKQGRGQALALAQRAMGVDPKIALTLLEIDPKPGSTAVQRVHRVVLKALCLEQLRAPPQQIEGPWSLTEQALLLDCAERKCTQAPKVARQLLALVSAPAHAVHRRMVEARICHAAGELELGWKLADALAADWLGPARAGSVNQCVERNELLKLLALFGPGAAARSAAILAAATPEIAVAEGDVL